MHMCERRAIDFARILCPGSELGVVKLFGASSRAGHYVISGPAVPPWYSGMMHER